MENNQTKRKTLLIALATFGLIGIVTGVSIAFFSYTRTGLANNIGTGRIFFSTMQNGTLNLTNVFPMTSSEAGEANLNAVTVTINGDTVYEGGEEFQITLVDVTNTVNGKKVPINYIATYTAQENKTIGASSNDYWNAREAKNASIYTLNATGRVEEDKQVLVGYIDDGATGVSGTLSIKAYVDADRIAISDTYPEETIRSVKTGGYSSSACETILTGVANASTYCASAEALQDAIDNDDLTSAEVALLVNAGLVEEYTNGTTSSWVRGRTVLTTTEWNSLRSTPISFKIRAESNEGIWVEEPPQGTIESCPDCKFIYTTARLYTTWNTSSKTPTVIDPSDLSESYLDVVEESGKDYFLGVVTNGSNQITKAYACGIYNGTTPFCIEGDANGTNYSANSSRLNGSSLWNTTCRVYLDANTGNGYDYFECGPWNNSSVSAYASSEGIVNAGVGNNDGCRVGLLGLAGCDESGGGEDPGR